MNINLSPELEKRVQRLVERGDYPSADALVREAVDSFLEIEDEEVLEEVRRRLQASDEEIDRGEFLEYDEHTIKNLAKDVHERGVKRLAQLRTSGPRG